MTHAAEAKYHIILGHFALLAKADTQLAVNNYEKASRIAKETNKARTWNKSDPKIVSYYLEMSNLLNKELIDQS